MLENPREIVEGAKIILKILGIGECHIGIESNKPDAILEMSKAAQEASDIDCSIKIRTLQVKYPQGSEKQLIQAVTGRKVPAMALPSSVGIVVQNVTTAKAIYDAVVYSKPLYEKVVTIAGKGIARPANLLVKIGTKIAILSIILEGLQTRSWPKSSWVVQ